MNDIVLVAPHTPLADIYGNLANAGNITPPLGICYIASYLEEKGYKVDIIDGSVRNLTLKQLVHQILSFHPIALGITSNVATARNAFELARAVKEKDSEIVTIFGGPFVSGLRDEALEKDFDYAIYGEGEVTTYELMKCIGGDLKPEEVDGLIYRKNGNVTVNKPRKYLLDLDELPLPARHLIPIQEYKFSPINFLRLPVTSMITSRGCPYRCIFCDSSTFGRKVRYHGVEYVIKEIEFLVSKYKIKEVRFDDATFTLNKERVIRICDEIINRNIDITWTCFSRTDNVDKELLQKMKDAGCWRIDYGIETGNQEVMDFLKKGLALDEVKNSIKSAKKIGIRVRGHFIIGYPIDTVETIDETINFARDMPLDRVIFTLIQPIPNTELYKICQEKGEIIHDYRSPCPTFDVSYVPPNLTKEDLEKKIKEAYIKFYLRPAYLLYRLLSIRSWRDMIRGWRMLKLNFAI